MLIELFGRNFGSFRDEFRLSMVAADIDRDNPRGIVEVELEGEDEPLRLLRCAAIYGPNASGKSTVLRAAAALSYSINFAGSASSTDSILAYESFMLDENQSREPTELGLKAVVDNRVYEYSIRFNYTEFLHECLKEYKRDGVQILFERNGRTVKGMWTSEKQFELLTASFRPNALLLSLADRLAPALAMGLATAFRRLLQFSDLTSHDDTADTEAYVAKKALRERKQFGRWLGECLSWADTGITGHTISPSPDAIETDIRRKQKKRTKSMKYRLSMLHTTPQEPIAIPFFLESMGTQRLVMLAPCIFDLTHDKDNLAYFIDEIGASMHPDLLKAMIRHFNCEVPQEQVRGQLIFATHETSLIDAEAKDAILRRDQIYLTDKDAAGASSLFSVADFKERNNLNLRRRYLQGRYGALPALGSFGD